MVWVKPDLDKKKKEENECACCIKIEESIVVIICGEVDMDNLKKCLQTALDAKDNTNLESQE